MTEPKITINDTTLTEGQAMTVRVALSNFQMELMGDVNSMGDDDHGFRMRGAYLARLSEISGLL